MDVQQFLNACTVDGNIIHVPKEQVDRDVYVRAKKALEKIGGKWKGGKVWGFLFDRDPTDLLQSIQNGEDRNIKKETQFFETPSVVVREMLIAATVDDTHTILEPSAGQGAIVDALVTSGIQKHKIHCVENDPHNASILLQKGYVTFVEDFLSFDRFQYDRILANPPFTKNQDIAHVRRMYECLKPGGRLVSVMSSHWTFATRGEGLRFRTYFDNMLDGYVVALPEQSFKESGTGVNTVIVVIDKPE